MGSVHVIEQILHAAEPIAKEIIEQQVKDAAFDAGKAVLHQGSQIVATVAAQHIAAHASASLCCTVASAVAVPAMATAAFAGVAVVGVAAVAAAGWGIKMLVEKLME